MSAPSLSIRIELESAPRIEVCCMSEGELARLLDWLISQDGLSDLYLRAIELVAAR